MEESMAVSVTRHRFSVHDYYQLAEADILSHEDRVELIEGEIIDMSPIGVRHISCVDMLVDLLTHLPKREWILRVQSPIRLNEHSEPQPDITLLKRRSDFYRSSPSTTADVLLVIEVSDSSVGYDRDIKIPLYARAGIPEAWLVDLTTNSIEVYSQPMNGVYQSVVKLSQGEILSSPRLPEIILEVTAIVA
jgi:Uma2 family endonuclease